MSLPRPQNLRVTPSAAFLVRNELIRAFGYKTTDRLIQEDVRIDVVAYLGSFAGGAVG